MICTSLREPMYDVFYVCVSSVILSSFCPLWDMGYASSIPSSESRTSFAETRSGFLVSGIESGQILSSFSLDKNFFR